MPRIVKGHFDPHPPARYTRMKHWGVVAQTALIRRVWMNVLKVTEERQNNR